MPPRSKSAAAAAAIGAGAPSSANASGHNTPSRYASRTAFEGLAVEGDDGDSEESEEEPEEEEQEEAVDESKPLTRSAKKRQAKLAREEKRRATKASKTGSAAAAQASAPSTSTPTRDSEGVAQAPSPPAAAPVQAPSVTLTAPSPKLKQSARADGSTDYAHQPQQAEAPQLAPTVSAFSAEPMSRGSSAVSAAAHATARAAEANRHITLVNGGEKAEKKKDPAAEKAAYWKKVYERTFYTFVMIGGFISLLLLGHPYMILLVMVIQTVVYREVTGLFNLPGRPHVTGGGYSTGQNTPSVAAAAGARTPAGSSVGELDEDYFARERGKRREELWSKTLSWYFFVVANYFLYGESMIYYFKHIVFVDAYFIPFARHHRFLSFMLYVFGFMAFILNLRRENLKRQFGLFAWVHMSLLLIVVSSHFLVNNILEGLIWMFVPASLVICNDIFAYVCGMLFGRTPLISLSPKKTMEGFFGAFVITVVFAYGWGSFFQQFKYMTCPAVSLGMNAFKTIDCRPNPVFLWRHARLPAPIARLLTSVLAPFLHGKTIETVPYTPFQLHSLVMAAFASLVAPFGGFFASGFKRAFNIKDFGDSIPGHGGLTDRFDCQFLMGLWAYVYYSSLIREHHVTVGSVLQTVVTHLSLDDQVELYREVGRFLQGQGVNVAIGV